jgi:hypothetical protein
VLDLHRRALAVVGDDMMAKGIWAGYLALLGKGIGTQDEARYEG